MPVVSPQLDPLEKPLLYTQFGMVSGEATERFSNRSHNSRSAPMEHQTANTLQTGDAMLHL